MHLSRLTTVALAAVVALAACGTNSGAGSGAGDIEGIDTGFIAQMRERGNLFVDLGPQRRSEYLDWKWKASLTKDGKQIAYGTDVGGLAMCYRRDLFEWDVAAVPGGGGNWGGSYLAILKQGKHIDEATALAAWLTAPEQQARVFTEQGKQTPEDSWKQTVSDVNRLAK